MTSSVLDCCMQRGMRVVTDCSKPRTRTLSCGTRKLHMRPQRQCTSCFQIFHSRIGQLSRRATVNVYASNDRRSSPDPADSDQYIGTNKDSDDTDIRAQSIVRPGSPTAEEKEELAKRGKAVGVLALALGVGFVESLQATSYLVGLSKQPPARRRRLQEKLENVAEAAIEVVEEKAEQGTPAAAFEVVSSVLSTAASTPSKAESLKTPPAESEAGASLLSAVEEALDEIEEIQQDTSAIESGTTSQQALQQPSPPVEDSSKPARSTWPPQGFNFASQPQTVSKSQEKPASTWPPVSIKQAAAVDSKPTKSTWPPVSIPTEAPTTIRDTASAGTVPDSQDFDAKPGSEMVDVNTDRFEVVGQSAGKPRARADVPRASSYGADAAGKAAQQAAMSAIAGGGPGSGDYLGGGSGGRGGGGRGRGGDGGSSGDDDIPSDGNDQPGGNAWGVGVLFLVAAAAASYFAYHHHKTREPPNTAAATPASSTDAHGTDIASKAVSSVTGLKDNIGHLLQGVKDAATHSSDKHDSTDGFEVHGGDQPARDSAALPKPAGVGKGTKLRMQEDAGGRLSLIALLIWLGGTIWLAKRKDRSGDSAHGATMAFTVGDDMDGDKTTPVKVSETGYILAPPTLDTHASKTSSAPRSDASAPRDGVSGTRDAAPTTDAAPSTPTTPHQAAEDQLTLITELQQHLTASLQAMEQQDETLKRLTFDNATLQQVNAALSTNLANKSEDLSAAQMHIDALKHQLAAQPDLLHEIVLAIADCINSLQSALQQGLQALAGVGKPGSAARAAALQVQAEVSEVVSRLPEQVRKMLTSPDTDPHTLSDVLTSVSHDLQKLGECIVQCSAASAAARSKKYSSAKGDSVSASLPANDENRTEFVPPGTPSKATASSPVLPMPVH